MNLYNPYTNVGLLLGVALNFITGEMSKTKRIILIVIGVLLTSLSLWLLLVWHSVPTYTHYIYLERLYSPRPSFKYMITEHKNDYYVSANYEMCLSSGASAFQNEKTIRFREEVQFIHELSYPMFESTYKNKKEWSSMFMNNRKPKKFSDVLSPKLSEQASIACAKNKLKISDFKYGYFFLHKYQDDISRYNYEKDEIRTINSETDTLNKYSGVSKRFIRNYSGKILDEDLFIKEKDMPKIPNIPFKGETKSVELISNGIGFYLGGMGSENQNAYSNFFYSLFQMYDLTKARYNIYLKSNAIDSINYTITFEEGVSFSDININPDYKDMNTLVYRVTDYDRQVELSNGIKFYVEFLESSNIQNVRIGLLLAFLVFPIGVIYKNVKGLFSTNSQEPKNNKKNKNSKSNSLLSNRKRKKEK